MKRYDFAPLAALARNRDGTRMSHGDIAAKVGLTASGVNAWSRRGIPEARAEQAAVALGFDPYNVWPEMLDDAIATVEKVCAHDVCDNVFVVKPHGTHRRYCSDRCRWASTNMTSKARTRRARRKRERYHADPDAREALLAKKRDWYAQNSEYARAAERARYHRLREAG